MVVGEGGGCPEGRGMCHLTSPAWEAGPRCGMLLHCRGSASQPGPQNGVVIPGTVHVGVGAWVCVATGAAGAVASATALSSTSGCWFDTTAVILSLNFEHVDKS